VPSSLVVTLTARQQALILAQLRQARYGHLLSLHILLLLHHGYSPTQIAACLFCSRSSVYRSVAAWRSDTLTLTVARHWPRSWWGRALTNGLRRKLTSLLRCVPRAFGWMRTRWSGACLALTLSRQVGYKISAETVRRWLHQADYVWKRPSLVARDDDPARATLLARIRRHWEELGPREALVFADELELHLLPKVGAQWIRRGQRLEIVTPGQDQRCHLAAALDFRTGRLLHRTGAKKNRFLFLDLLRALDRAYAEAGFRRVYVVADNYSIHTAGDVCRWLACHPRFVLLWLPRYCPKANPIERIFGDLHDRITRNHRHHTLPPLLAEVQRYLRRRAPHGQLPSIYREPAVKLALRQLRRKAA
jgi:putative transposase